MLIGSKAFRNLWEDWQRDYQPLQVLKLLLAYIGMPEDLSGELEETQHLLSYFDPDLAPHDSFWKDVVKLVDLAFPGDSLSKNASIERQIHQLRYLISSQQAQYVRTHYKKPGMTDKEALAVYLRWKPFTMFDQGRLHQKVSICDGKAVYPDGIPSVNLKILLYNRIEFILDSQGNFLNEVDAEQVTESGVVNGASFNYGNFKRHWQLDVEPVQPHDPDFRNRMTKGFRSPNKLKNVGDRKYLNNLINLSTIQKASMPSPIGLWQMMSNAKPDFFSLWFMAINRFRKSKQRRFICLNNHKTIKEQRF